LHLAGLKPEKTELIQSFVDKKLGVGSLERIDVVGTSLDELEIKFKGARDSLAAEMALKPDPWSASKAVDGLIRSGYFRTQEKRSIPDIIATLVEQDPRAKGRDKMIYSTVKRRFDKGKIQGEKLDNGWHYWAI
jgi:hypothetical protein